MKFLFSYLLVFVCGLTILAQPSNASHNFRFSEQEKELLSTHKKYPDRFTSNYNLGSFYYNRAVHDMMKLGLSEINPDSLPEAIFYMRSAKAYLEKARELDSTNVHVEEALIGIQIMVGEEPVETYVDPQAFRVVNGDTINKIDEIGMLQGEWERLHPDGSFRCRGTYKDNKKSGYWERKYTNGNWQYQVYFENGYPHGYGKWYFTNGKLKTEGNYYEGKEDGLFKVYYDDGTIRREESFIMGKIKGLCKYYNEKGVLKSEGVSDGEEREGEWKFYSEKGQHTTSVFYEKGVAVKTVTVD